MVITAGKDFPGLDGPHVLTIAPQGGNPRSTWSEPQSAWLLADSDSRTWDTGYAMIGPPLDYGAALSLNCLKD